MFEKDKISVVTVLDKGSRFYLTTMKSYFAQTYQNREWIIIDNTNNKVVAARLKPYMLKNSALKLVANEAPLSRAEILKQVFKTCKGRYIAFLKPEDYWLPDKLLRQSGFMLRYNAPISHTSYAFADDKYHLLPVGCYHIKKELNMVNYNAQNPVSISTVMFDKERISFDAGKFEEMKDFDFMMMLLVNGFVSSGMSDVLTLCRPIFDKKMRQKIEEILCQYASESKEDKTVSLRILEHYAFQAVNIASLSLDPAVCISYDVVDGLNKLKNFKI